MEFYYFILLFLISVISACFKVYNNDNSSVTSSIVLLLLLLCLSMLLVSFILFDIFWDNLCFILLLYLLHSLWSQLSKCYHSHLIERLSRNSYSGVFVFFLPVMPLNTMWYARIGVFQLTRFKSTSIHASMGNTLII